MHVLFMADVPRDPNAGAAGTEVQTADALRRLGHDVDEVWAPQLRRRIGHGNLHYLVELPRAYRREMLKAAAAKQYDVLHVNQPHGWLAAKSKPRQAVFVHRSHGLELRAERDLAPWRARYGHSMHLLNRVMAALLARHSRLIARYADGHIVSCSDDARFLTDQLGVEVERVAIIPQGVPDMFLASPPPPMSVDRLRRVLYAGQYAFFKAPMIVAAAMREIVRRHPGVQLTWVCDRAHHAAVRALLGDIPVDILDWMPAARLMEVYDTHGIFLFASFFEGFGKVFLEAMSRGLCVVATRVAGARDLMTDGENGLLVDPGDSDAIANAADALFADPHRAAMISANAVRLAGRYTWRQVASETAAFYERLRAMRT